jgi:hypothetical protein
MTTLAKLVAQVALQNVNHDLIQDLERDAQTLDRIRDSFSWILDKRVLKVWSFEEELAVTGGGKVCVTCLWYDSFSSLSTIRLCMVTPLSLVMLVRTVGLFMLIT